MLAATRKGTKSTALVGMAPVAASFLQRPSLRVKHASLVLLHGMAVRNDVGASLALASGSRLEANAGSPSPSVNEIHVSFG